MIVSSSFADQKDTINGHVGALSNQLNKEIGDVPGNKYNADIEFRYHANEQDKLERKFDFAALVNDESLTMFSVQEAYVAKKGIFRSYNYTLKTGDEFKIGRQILPWSSIDHTWGFGKLNNRKYFNGFDPGHEGLVGAYYKNKSSSGFFWGVFASALYVPELNPGMDINKGDQTITSRNPWANAPAPTTEIDGNETPIKYIVDYPEISDVVNRYTIGFNAGWESKHWVMDAFIIRKPENKFSTQVEIALPEDSNSVKAFITPEFYYHDVFGANLKYRNHDVEMYLSGIAAFPESYPDGDQQATRFTEIKTAKKREAYGGGGIAKSNDKYGFGLNYVARLSAYDRELDSLAEDPRWNQAVNVFGVLNLFKKYSILADVKYDMLTTDRLVMLKGSYSLSKEFLMSLGVNMIGTPGDGKSYWSPFTNNDAVYAALRYVY